jgi:hypothetical protein
MVTVHSENMTIYILGMNGYQEEDRMATKGTKDTGVKSQETHFVNYVLSVAEFSYWV